MAAPAVDAIRRALPGAELVAQSRAAFLPLARLLPGVGSAVPAGADRGIRDLWRSRRALRGGGFDAAVVFPRSFRAALAPWLAGIPVRVGFGARGRRRLLTHAVEGWQPLRRRHRSTFYGALARPFGVESEGPWRLEAPPAALEAADRLLLTLGRRSGRPLVAMEAGASFGPAKCWAPERFGGLARRLLREDGADVVTLGTAASRDVEAKVAEAAGPGLLRAVGRTDDLLALVGLLARADLLVSNDTGPMHLAAALGTPVLAIFGATDPGVSAPRGHGRNVVLVDPEPCSPCFLRDCPIPGHPCLAKIGVDVVHRALVPLLSLRRPA
jgi:heptosyltransferase-2